MSYLTDTEKRLLFSALRREKEVCQKIDDTKVEDATCKMLVPVVESLERKFYYDRFEQEIRNKAIEELKELVRGHKYTNAEDGTTVEEMLKDENTEKKYAWHLSNNACCDWMLHRLDEIAEQMKEVGE